MPRQNAVRLVPFPVDQDHDLGCPAPAVVEIDANHDPDGRLLLARRKHPGSPNRLDDLCSRYGIDSSRRVKHGALLDAEILAEVYLELIGGRQAQLILVETGSDSAAARTGRATPLRPRPIALTSRLTEADRAAHVGLRASLGDHPIWDYYLPASTDAFPAEATAASA